ncbi:MAG: glycosyltransferase family 2 protein, partial [Armatimonadetes bacterium]|nr:glycosyltransferase family 2 protein [Armatimonadota bacterium]
MKKYNSTVAQCDLSVVIPTLNRREVLKRVLDALAHQTYPADRYEVVVVDDGSTDGTQDVVEAAGRTGPPAVRYVRQTPGKRGPASANNLGIKAAQGEWILFLNDDVVADPHLVEEHVRFHRAYGDIIVQGRVVNT